MDHPTNPGIAGKSDEGKLATTGSHGQNSNQQHHALRLALGSILNPKRSPSSSGSSSPFHAHHSTPTHTPTVPTSTSSGSYFHTHHYHSGPGPSRLSFTRISSTPSSSGTASPEAHDEQESQRFTSPVPPPLPPPSTPADSTVTTTSVGQGNTGYVEKLKSKSAWDALIHGSFH